jgi:hypothetical protein
MIIKPDYIIETIGNNLWLAVAPTNVNSLEPKLNLFFSSFEGIEVIKETFSFKVLIPDTYANAAISVILCNFLDSYFED